MWNTVLFFTVTSLLCFCRVVFGKQEFPIFNWPLHQNAKVYETMEGVAQDPSQSGIQYGGQLYNSLNTLYFDGTHFVDINVGTHSFQDKDDYTFTFYLKPLSDVKTEYCFFHYQHDGAGTGTISIKMTISNTDLSISRTLDTGMMEIFTFTQMVAFDQWQLFSVAMDNSKGKLSVNVLGSSKKEQSGEVKQTFQTPGVLRIGGCFDYVVEKFTGYITCLSLFDKKLGSSDLDDVDTACEESTYICHASTLELTSSLNSATCPSLTVPSTPSPLSLPLHFSTARYDGTDITLLTYLTTQDHAPDPDLHLYVATYPGCSLFQCGTSCMMDVNCLSFSLEKLSDGLGTCRIYDSIITNRVHISQSAYYAKQ